MNSIVSIKQLKATMLKEISNHELTKKGANDGVEDNKKTILNVKESYLQDISQKTMFDEVYKN
jgi:hypothetical protein